MMSRVILGLLLVVAAVVSVLFVDVYFAAPLELEVVNESGDAAVVEIRGRDVPDEATSVEPGDRHTIDTDRSGVWSVWVNGRESTSWELWPMDNPTIDLAVYVRSDGSVEVIDD